MNNLISTTIGVLIALMIFMNGSLTKLYGNYTSTVIIHLVGLAIVILLMIIKRVRFNLKQNIPLYLYSAGAIGIFTVLCNNLSFITLGASLTLALGLLGQSIASLLIDHFGLLGMQQVQFQKRKAIGLSLIIVGIIVMAIY